MESKMQILNRFAHLLEICDTTEVTEKLYEKLDILVYLHETIIQEKMQLKQNEIFLESLVMKFYLHGVTLCNIASGYKIKSDYLDNRFLSQNILLDISSLFTIGKWKLF